MRKADTSADPVVEDALAKGYLGTGQVYSIPGFTTHDAANNGRLSVSRAVRRRNLSAGIWVADQDGQQCYTACQDPSAPHSVHFRLWSKDEARAHVFQQTGGDPANLKYNPWERGRRQAYDDAGNPV
jgi:hypothetical protein